MIPETHSVSTFLGLFLTGTGLGLGWVLGCSVMAWACGRVFGGTSRGGAA